MCLIPFRVRAFLPFGTVITAVAEYSVVVSRCCRCCVFPDVKKKLVMDSSTSSLIPAGIVLGPVNHVLPGHLRLVALLHTALADRRVVVDLRHDDLATLLRLAVPVAPLGGAREVVPAGVVAAVPLAHVGLELIWRAGWRGFARKPWFPFRLDTAPGRGR